MEKEIVKFPKGEVIFQKGEVQFCLYEILSGSVAIYTDYGMNSQTLLTEMKPGQTFGEMSILSYRPRTATAVAASDVEAVRIDDTGFEAYLEENPERVIAMMKQISERIRDLSGDYREALVTSAEIKKQQRNERIMAKIRKFARVWAELGVK